MNYMRFYRILTDFKGYQPYYQLISGDGKYVS